jgi:hypothetical protein
LEPGGGKGLKRQSKNREEQAQPEKSTGKRTGNLQGRTGKTEKFSRIFFRAVSIPQ